MPDLRDVELLRLARETRFEPNHKPTWGVIVEVDGSTVPQPGLVWVDEFGRSQSRKKYLNPSSLTEAGTVVVLGPDEQPPYRKVVGVYVHSVAPGSDVPVQRFALPNHGRNHQYVAEDNRGPDPALIFMPAIQPLKTMPFAGLVVVTQPYDYIYQGQRKRFPGAYTDLSDYLPETGEARRVLLYLNPATNTLQVEAGTAVPSVIPVPFSSLPDGMRGSAWVKLVSGQTAVSATDDLTDARDLFGGGAGNHNHARIHDGSTAVETADGEIYFFVSDVQTAYMDEAGFWLTISDDGSVPVVIILDEDDMASDRDDALATQQSIKAYVDSAMTGNVVGPGSATDNAIVRFDSTTGKLIKDTSNATINDNGRLILSAAGVNGGVLIGGDVHLYRSAANVLTLPDAMFIDGVADTIQLLVQGNGTQTNPIITIESSNGTDRLTVSNAGQLGLPTTGSSAGILIGGDVHLYRSDTDQLAIPDSLLLGNNALFTSPFANVHRITLVAGDSGADVALQYEVSGITTNNASVRFFRVTNITGRASLDILRANNSTTVNCSIAGNGDTYLNQSTGNVGIGTTSPAASAKLDISSTTGALLVPRMTTTQRNALTPVDGMILYDTTEGKLLARVAGAWSAI